MESTNDGARQTTKKLPELGTDVFARIVKYGDLFNGRLVQVVSGPSEKRLFRCRLENGKPRYLFASELRVVCQMCKGDRQAQRTCLRCNPPAQVLVEECVEMSAEDYDKIPKRSSPAAGDKS